MKKVLITGFKGRIGKILTPGLKKDYDLTLADLPEINITDYKKVLEIVQDHDSIIHLAWDTKTENFSSGKSNPDNILMAKNIYRAALEKGVPRVIIASSVRADDSKNYKGNKLLTPDDIPKPISPYGRSKVLVENLGRDFSKKGLEVVCIRFGAIGYKKPKDEEGKMVWFSNPDFISLIKTTLEAKKIPGNFLIMYGVSNNKTRIHDYSNSLGWKPKDDSSKLIL